MMTLLTASSLCQGRYGGLCKQAKRSIITIVTFPFSFPQFQFLGSHFPVSTFSATHEAAGSYQASDRFAEQKMIVFDSMKRLIRMFYTSALQIFLEEDDLIAYR